MDKVYQARKWGAPPCIREAVNIYSVLHSRKSQWLTLPLRWLWLIHTTVVGKMSPIHGIFIPNETANSWILYVFGCENYGAHVIFPKKIDPFTMSYSGGFFGILETLGTLRTLPAHSQDRAMSVVVTPLWLWYFNIATETCPFIDDLYSY